MLLYVFTQLSESHSDELAYYASYLVVHASQSQKRDVDKVLAYALGARSIYQVKMDYDEFKNVLKPGSEADLLKALKDAGFEAEVPRPQDFITNVPLEKMK